MTLVCTGCRRRFDLIVDTPYTRTLAAFLTNCPHCGGLVEALSNIHSVQTSLQGFGQKTECDPPSPTFPYALTDDDRTFLRVNRIDPEI